MLRLGFIILVLLTVRCSKKDSTTGTDFIDTTTVSKHTNDKVISNQTSECDSLKVGDFKSNLSSIENLNDSSLTKVIDEIAKFFIKTECENDDLFCKEIELNSKRYYKSADSNENLFCYGYRFRDSKGMDEDSNSFYVFGTYQNDYLTFHDIAEELIGEIKLFPKGLQAKSGTTIIWGEMYPYFARGEYGKFRLEIKRNFNEYYGQYEFQCNYMSR
jgi:hypothetical protein